MRLRDLLARHWPILAAAAATALVVTAAWALSYSALMALGRSAGEVGTFLGLQLDAIYPVTVDGTLAVAIVGALVLRSARLQTRAYAWGLIGAATAVSIAGNAAHSLAHGGDLVLPPLAAAAASAVPACSLAASLHLLILVARGHREAARGVVVSAAPAAAATSIEGARARSLAAPAGRTPHARSEHAQAEPLRAPEGVRHAQVRALLAEPGGHALTGRALGERLGIDAGYARRLRAEVQRADSEPGRRPRVLEVAAEPAAAVVAEEA